MTKIKLENVKLVIVGQDPTHDKPSEGLAFHKVPCPSTRYILDHLRDEMELINHWEIKEKISGLNGPEMTMDSERLKISDAKLKRIKEECDLSGWIAQGVLPVNASLTYKGDTNVESPESKPWKPLMRWLLTYLYKREGAPHMVYILVGSEARKVMGDYPDMLVSKPSDKQLISMEMKLLEVPCFHILFFIHSRITELSGCAILHPVVKGLNTTTHQESSGDTNFRSSTRIISFSSIDKKEGSRNGLTGTKSQNSSPIPDRAR